MSGKKGFPVWNSTLRRKTGLSAARPKEGKPFKRSTLNARSDKQARRLADYYRMTGPFLVEFPICAICLARGLPCPNAATEVHHIRGRLGALLFDKRYWAPSCYACRLWPHDNKEEARKVGVLAERNDWGKIDR